VNFKEKRGKGYGWEEGETAPPFFYWKKVLGPGEREFVKGEEKDSRTGGREV